MISGRTAAPRLDDPRWWTIRRGLGVLDDRDATARRSRCGDRASRSRCWRLCEAWAISLQTGLVTPIATAGIECRNEGWGL